MADSDAVAIQRAKIQKLRTYAEDLERARKAKPDAPETLTHPKPNVPPEIVASPKTATKKTTPKKTAAKEKTQPAPPPAPPTKPQPKGLKQQEKFTVERTSILGDEDQKIFDERKAAGTIVSDKKRDRWTFGKAITGAARDWASETADALTPEQVVEEEKKLRAAKTRSDVIAAASQSTKSAPLDDHDAVLERLRTLRRAHQKSGSSLRIKKRSEVSATNAKPTNVPSPRTFDPLPTAEKKVIEDVVVPKAAPTPVQPIAAPKPAPLTPPVQPTPVAPPVQPAPATSAPPLTPPHNVPTAAPIAPAPAALQPVQSQSASGPITSATQPVVNASMGYRAAAEQATQNPVAPLPATAPAQPPRTERNALPQIHQSIERPTSQPSVVEQLRRENGQPLSVARPSLIIRVIRPLIIIALIIAIIASLTGGILFYLNQQAANDAPVEIVTSLIRTDSETKTPLPSNRRDLLALLTKTTASPTRGITEVNLVVSDANGIEQEATANEIINVLTPRVPGAFSRSITELSIGVVSEDTEPAPYIVLVAPGFDTAFAGMINWEPFMSEDLEPFFGSAVRNTSLDSDFTDIVIANQDVRVLTDVSGEERILYTFSDQQTIMITTNRSALETILRAVR